jgi:hypothetical protein
VDYTLIRLAAREKARPPVGCVRAQKKHSANAVLSENLQDFEFAYLRNLRLKLA